MRIPERLITIRTYDAPELAAEDHRALSDAGFDAYLTGSTFRPGGVVELRVAESQADEALEQLPPEVPTLQDLTRPSARCRICGGGLVRDIPPLARIVLFGGLGLAAVSVLRGDTRAAIVLVLTAVALTAMLRNVAGVRRCEQCGSVWQPDLHEE